MGWGAWAAGASGAAGIDYVGSSAWLCQATNLQQSVSSAPHNVVAHRQRYPTPTMDRPPVFFVREEGPVRNI